MSKDTIEKHQRTEHKAERRAELRPAAVESATVFGCDRLGLGSYGCPANAAQRSPNGLGAKFPTQRNREFLRRNREFERKNREFDRL
jgi:hypothetical protein